MHPSLYVAVAAACASDPTLVRVAEHASGAAAGAEIVSVQSSTARALLLDSGAGRVEVLDLAEPARPRLVARHELALAEGEHATSVAIHPCDGWYLVAVQAAGAWAPGRLEARSLEGGERLAAIPCGIGPDSVIFDASGTHAAAACEGEGYDFDPATRTFTSPWGSVTLCDLSAGPANARGGTLSLPACDDVPGALAPADGRALERAVDWNRNGRIDAEVDFDGDGTIGDAEVLVGSYEGREVRAKERDGEVFLLPLGGASASAVEPECLAFSPDGARLYVTLQEVNACAVFDVARGALVARYGLGATRHAADLRSDGRVAFEDELAALREPDGIALAPHGRWFVTADEGDTEPKASKVAAPGRAGGGRSLSVFDASTGALLGDTRDELDRAAQAAGLYPDERSDNKGSEPEMVAVFELDGRLLAAASLERAGGVALVDLTDGARPRVLGVAGSGASAEASRASRPEGIAVLQRPGGGTWVLAANEGTGTLTVFEVRRAPR